MSSLPSIQEGRPLPTTNVAVRKRWMFTLISASQRFICDAALPHNSWQDALGRLLSSIPESRNRIEDLLLRSVLARLVVVFARKRDQPTNQTLTMAHAVADILLNERVTPQQAFLNWGRLASLHRRPSKHADVASLIVRRSLFETVDLNTLAGDIGCSERLVRVAFQRAHGMSPRRYKRRTKVLCAIELLRKETWDNETVARELGFRSPKNLYRALRLDTGLTPRQIRLLSDGDLTQLRTRIAPDQTGPDPVLAGALAGPASRITRLPENGEAAVARRKVV